MTDMVLWRMKYFPRTYFFIFPITDEFFCLSLFCLENTAREHEIFRLLHRAEKILFAQNATSSTQLTTGCKYRSSDISFYDISAWA